MRAESANLGAFEFGAPGRIVFGRGASEQAGELASEFGHSALVLVGSRSLAASGGLARVEASLQASGIRFQAQEVVDEPSVSTVDELVQVARHVACSCILAVGGGSVIDAAKAVGIVMTNTVGDDESCRDFLEGVGKGRVPTRPPRPVIAMPTTAGTGAEATRNAVISSDDRTFKKSLRHASMRPAIAVVDPLLTASAPPEITAACGADALAQLIEAYLSSRASLPTDAFAREGIRLCAWALERAVADGSDLEARDGMALAGLLSGLALDNAGLGAVHGLASPIGAFFPIPHGVVCGNLLPPIIRANLARARARLGRGARTDPEAARVLERYREIASLFNGDFACEPENLAPSLEQHRFLRRIPSFARYGIGEADIPRILASCRAGSMKTNPFELDDAMLGDAIRWAIRRG